MSGAGTDASGAGHAEKRRQDISYRGDFVNGERGRPLHTFAGRLPPDSIRTVSTPRPSTRTKFLRSRGAVAVARLGDAAELFDAFAQGAREAVGLLARGAAG